MNLVPACIRKIIHWRNSSTHGSNIYCTKSFWSVRLFESVDRRLTYGPQPVWRGARRRWSSCGFLSSGAACGMAGVPSGEAGGCSAVNSSIEIAVRLVLQFSCHTADKDGLLWNLYLKQDFFFLCQEESSWSVYSYSFKKLVVPFTTAMTRHCGHSRIRYIISLPTPFHCALHLLWVK